MDYQIITLKNKDNHQLVHDVILYPLTVNSDPRGSLTEIMKTTWEGIYDDHTRPFTQVYISRTAPGVARDVDQWHFHPGGQEDRFGVISGDIITAIYDNRDGSPTKGVLNLFLLGESEGEDGQYLLLIPPRAYHGYVVVSDAPATMFNFPTRLYDPKEEHRLPFQDYRLPGNQVFSWDLVKAAYTKR